MERIGQQALNQFQAYAAEWKQPINFSKTEWRWIHRRAVIPTLSLSLSIGQHPIQRTAVYKYLGYHVDERLSFNAQAFIHPYLQIIDMVWPMLSLSSIEKIDAKNRQLSRLIHNWWDANNDEVQWLRNYEIAESKAQRFLRRSIDESETISPKFFEDFIRGKAMPMYM